MLRAVGWCFDQLSKGCAVMGEIALVALVLLVFHEVVARYVFGRPTVFSVEISEYLLVFIAFMSAAWVLQKDRHVRMEVVVTLLPPRVAVALDILTSAVVVVFCAILAWKGYTTVLMAYSGSYHSSSEVNMPLWIPYAFIPLGAFMLGLQLLVRIGAKLTDLVRPAPPQQTLQANGNQ
jgi:TRAP-type C4-dicarboxylate transport system permease small subunit